ncbi:hypothetical protein AB0K16_25430 [Nonomuraea jabiensis]|uniref:hypothetical protein n=1 Tax=Nonomuraea jabiensis TaxID=882448 RepID=UPI00343BC6CC
MPGPRSFAPWVCGGRARGILVREPGGGEQEVQADAVVLSAGAVCNAGPALRALSGQTRTRHAALTQAQWPSYCPR